jgi:gluconokinase
MVIVLMGVSGSGKTAVGEALAARLEWSFADADDLHPPANVERMRSGVPLTDADREPWLRSVNLALRGWLAARRDVVLACSALRRSHRATLRTGVPDDGSLRFVYLRAEPEELDRRLRARRGHFMPASMLESQLDTLEEPDPAEALSVDVQRPIPAIVDAIVRDLPV